MLCSKCCRLPLGSSWKIEDHFYYSLHMQNGRGRWQAWLDRVRVSSLAARVWWQMALRPVLLIWNDCRIKCNRHWKWFSALQRWYVFGINGTISKMEGYGRGCYLGSWRRKLLELALGKLPFQTVTMPEACKRCLVKVKRKVPALWRRCTRHDKMEAGQAGGPTMKKDMINFVNENSDTSSCSEFSTPWK